MEAPSLPWPVPLMVAGVAALAFRWALPLPSTSRIPLLLLLLLVILTPPAFVDDTPLVRLYVAMGCWTVGAKLWDLSVGASRGRLPGWKATLGFLASPFALVERRLDGEGRLGGREVAMLAGEGALMAALAAAGFMALHHGPAPSFAVEHVLLTAAAVLAISGGMDLLFALWQALGGRGRRIMDRVYIARTPADFWRRWNRPMGQFFLENVARPAGGRHLRRGLLVAFAFSAVLHEYLASIAVGRVQGFQTAYFLLHGVAVACTARLDPRGAWTLPAVLLTLAFNVATATLIFATLRQLLRWYASPVPQWMLP